MVLRVTPNFKDNIDEIFERGEREKGSNMTAEIMELDIHRIYIDDCDLPRMLSIKGYVGQLMNNKRARAIIEFYYHISSGGIRGSK